MVETGSITPAEAQEAANQIAFPPQPASGAGWFADWAADQAQASLDGGTDAVLHTTMDARLQAVTEQKLTAMLNGPGATAAVGQGAVVVLDAGSGAVRAIAGGREYHAGAFDRAVLARRQPGSAFKPFVWLAALEKGARPDDLVLDAPIRVGGWSPSNFDGRFRGEITVETALAESINTASVRLEQLAGGPRAVAAVARRLGIADRLPDNASLALGTAEVGVMELAGAYAAFFNGGMLVGPTGLTAITTDGPHLGDRAERARAGGVARPRRDDAADDDRGGRPRQRPRRRHSGPPRGRQERHHPGFPRRLVRRRRRRHGHRGLARQRRRRARCAM